MVNVGMTRREAAGEWVKGFNAISTTMIAKLWNVAPEDWCEVTLPEVGNSVYAYNYGSGEIIKVDYESDRYTIELNSGRTIEVEADQMEVEYDSQLPMCGTMWSFGDGADVEWVGNYNGLQVLSSCGFRIFKSEEFGYFLGIDGAGYDFYEAHWIPLYKERGLRWHNIDD